VFPAIWSFFSFVLDRIYRIIQDYFYFHHFPEESDETQSRLTAGKISQFFDGRNYVYSPKAIEIFGFHPESQKNIQLIL
jgi:hypothetical protein